MKTHLKRLFSGALSVVMAISAIPVVSAHAVESDEPYPYTMFAASNAEGAITVNDTEYRGMYVSCFVAHTANGEDSNCPMAHSGTVDLWGIAATDWSFAVGQGFGSIRGRVKKNADGTYTMTYRYYLCDIYEWCVDHSTNEMNIEDKMYALHLYGWAKQFLIDGYFESTITWSKGERLSGETELYNSTISNLIFMSMEAASERIRQGTYVVA